MNTQSPNEPCGSPPYLQPSSIEQTKQNMRYYRDQAGLTQRDVAAQTGISLMAYNKYEMIGPKALNMPLQHVGVIAGLFNCAPYLIDPATPYNREHPSNWPAFYHERKLRVFNEHPKTAKDYATNLRYLISRADYPLVDLAKAINISSAAIVRWASSGGYSAENVLKALQVIGCPELMPYVYPVRGTAAGAVFDPETGVELKPVSPPRTVADLKNNLVYHIKAKNLTYKELEDGLRLSKGTLRRYCDPASTVYLDPVQAATLANVYGMNLLEISPNAIFTGVEVFNARDFTVLDKYPGILDKPIGALAAAGPATPYAETQTKETFGEYMHLSSLETSGTVTIVGDSMYNYETGEGLPEGSLAFVDMSRRDVDKVVGERVCWCTPDGEMMVKRLVQEGEGYYLVSDNPDISPHCFPVPYGAVLLGVVTGFAKSL